MSTSRDITAFILTLSFITMSIAACDTRTDRNGGVAPTSPTATMTPTTSPTGSPSTALTPFDREFLMNAARGGMMEVQLGNLATQKASNAQVKQFAERAVTYHSQAGQALRQLASNLNITLPQDLDPEQRNMVSRLENLSGKEFDREFMKTMVTEYEKAVSEYERAANQATNPEVKQYASQTLPTLREHLKLAREVASKVGVKTTQSQ
jgi:putative membrane protein